MKLTKKQTPPKVCLISLGCAKNLVNSEQMLSLLDDAGCQLMGSPEGSGRGDSEHLRLH